MTRLKWSARPHYQATGSHGQYTHPSDARRFGNLRWVSWPSPHFQWNLSFDLHSLVRVLAVAVEALAADELRVGGREVVGVFGERVAGALGATARSGACSEAHLDHVLGSAPVAYADNVERGTFRLLGGPAAFTNSGSDTWSG